MIDKGKIRGDGGQLIAYILQGKEGERAELGSAIGFAQYHPNPIIAARLLDEAAAAKTNCKKPWFHAQIRLAPGEDLSNEKWEAIIERQEQRHGFEGLPRIWSFHIDERTGERHLHVAWYRIDLDRERPFAVDPGLYKKDLNRLSRQFEREYGLRQVSSERQPHDRARYAERNEVEESRRIGTDVRAIRNAVLEAFERSDSGRAFKAAIQAQGFELAQGERRNCFVIIDQAGGHHALNKKLTGKTLAEIERRFADLDRRSLPSVEKAQEMQRAGRPDRDAEKAQELREQWHAAQQQAEAKERATAPENAPPPPPKPLGKTAGEIRLAWQTTKHRGVDAFAEELEHRGLILVHVSRAEAEASHRAHQFAEAIGSERRELREGFAVVDSRGNVTRIDQRVTGDHAAEIEKRLSGIDRAELVSVAEAKEAQAEANRIAWREKMQREEAAARAATPTEQKILDAARAAEGDREKFEGELAKEGLGLARVTARDVSALESLRQDEFAAHAADPAHVIRFFPEVREGELAALDRYGGVHRLNQHHMSGIEQHLAERPPSVTELRAAFEIGRETAAEFRQAMIDIQQGRQDEATRARVLRSENREAEAEARRFDATIKHEAESALDDVAGPVGGGIMKAASAGAAFVAQVADKLAGIVEGLGEMLFPTAPPPPEEQKAKRRTEAEQERTIEGMRTQAEQEAALQEQLRQLRREEQIRELRRARGEITEERDDDRGRERDR
jgi:hypothetical protein